MDRLVAVTWWLLNGKHRYVATGLGYTSGGMCVARKGYC